MKGLPVKFALFLFVSFITLNMFTVGKAKGQVALGIKAAGNMTNYMNLTNMDFGMEAGVFMRLGNKLFFQPEVNYVFKNSTFKENAIEEISTNEKLRQHTIAVPLLLGFHFINKENFKFHFTVGPRFNFRISDNVVGTDWKAGALQWGGQIGLGIDVWRFAFDVSYCIAADNFRNSVTTVTHTQMANTILFSLGFKFLK
ncbi:MAG: PorT family protein [Bacteroidales bacterium]|nr:PorT family protein [Bacteroidales bacterium]